MPRRKPPSRVAVARSSENDPRELLEPSPPLAAREALAANATLVPYAKHKKSPGEYGLKPYEGEHEDPSYCDDHAGFWKKDMDERAEMLLQRGVLAGLWGDKTKKGDPSMLWSVDNNGWLYEAQITNPGYAQYHAYPVQPTEAIARKVLARYANYVESKKEPVLQDSLKLARERYK
jgi:hypothetical protein